MRAEAPEVLVTPFPALPIVYGMKRNMRVTVRQILRMDLKLERIFVNRHVKHTFELPWRTLTRDDRTTLENFFKAVRGRALGDIDFVDPWDATHYTCRLDNDDLQLNESDPGRWGSTLRLIEVANWKPLKPAVPVFPTFASGAVVQLPYRMNRVYRTEIQAQEDDSEKRFEDYAAASGIQRWLVGGTRLDDPDTELLINTWEGNAGPFRTMSFTEPETGVVYPTVHFMDLECIHELNGPCLNTVRLTVEELK